MRWPWVSRARLEAALAEIAGLRITLARADERFHEVEGDRRRLVGCLAEADAANKRLAGRNKALGEQLEAAQSAAGLDVAHARRMAERIARLQKAVKAARQDAAKARRDRPAGVASEVHRLRSANPALDEQARVLQGSNEAMTRELYDLRTGGGEAS